MTDKCIPYGQHLYKRISYRILCLYCCLLIGFCLQTRLSQAQLPPAIGVPFAPPVDEIVIELYVKDIGDTSIAALISEEKVWLSISGIFEFLMIPHNASAGGDSLSGYFFGTASEYLIDAARKQISFNGSTLPIPASGLIRSNKTLYLRADLFGDFFKLNCQFDFRSLSVKLFTALELPLFVERRQAFIRSNIGKFENEQKADSTLNREHSFFRTGMADWSFFTTSDFKGVSDFHANLTLGAQIAGGESVLSLRYDSKRAFSSRQQSYLWRYINNDSKLLRQVSLGRVATNATSSIFAPIIGIQFSNSPTHYRRNFSLYRINRYTEPNWVVEMYVNNTLVDYTKADASGFFSFDIPIVYGNTNVQLRYYGPNCEQRMGEANISMPFTFLPPGQLEYNVVAGVLEDSTWSKFTRAQLTFGMLKKLTIGGGVEYLSSVAGPKAMAFFNANFRLSRNFLFTSEYMHDVRYTITGNYRTTANVLYEVTYTKYKPGQRAISNTYIEERRASISYPLKFKFLNTYTRFSAYQIILPAHKYTTVEGLFSGTIFGSTGNITTYALFTENTKAYFYSNVSLAIRIPGKMIFMPQAQYEYNQSRFISLKIGLEKRFSTNGYVNGFYEKNYKNDFNSFNIGIRYELPHTLAGLDMRKNSTGELSFINSISGSLVHDSRSFYTRFTREPSVGRGGLILLTYLDLNNNQKYDKGEPKLKGLNFNIQSGRRDENKHDSTIVIRNLEAYNSFLITLDQNSFEEISWQIKLRTIKVEIDPNQFRLIEIPVSILGEVNGTIYTQTEAGKKIQERILINIYNKSGTFVTSSLSEADGYYNYLGLLPGSYTAKPDAEQMRKLGLRAFPGAWNFEITGGRYGDVQSGIDFTLFPKASPDQPNATNEQFAENLTFNNALMHLYALYPAKNKRPHLQDRLSLYLF